MSERQKVLAVKHYIFGNVLLNVLVEQETDCGVCVHKQVCRQSKPEFCENYEFGTSRGNTQNCDTCVHRYTRYTENNPVKCFKCKHLTEPRDFMPQAG